MASPKLNFDLNRFYETLVTSASHKHLFTAVTLVDGGPLGAMSRTLKAYADVGIPDSDVFPVGVLYHDIAVMLGFDDRIWNEYFYPAMAKLPKDNDDFKEMIRGFNAVASGKHGNPCLPKQGGEWDASITTLIAKAGMRLYVCNNATHGFANFIAKTLKHDATAVYKDMAAHLVPNAMLVPAGVWAVHAIQEQRFTLLEISLA
jgi:intracellular sulfur oxidation DsrE/DsrF family protein